MFKAINGWTKSKILKVLRARRYNVPATDVGTSMCLYLTPNGNKCAVGMFIPSGHKGANVRGSIGELLREFPDLKKYMPLTFNGLSDLQGVHDGCAMPESETKNAKQAMIDWVEENVA